MQSPFISLRSARSLLALFSIPLLGLALTACSGGDDAASSGASGTTGGLATATAASEITAAPETTPTPGRTPTSASITTSTPTSTPPPSGTVVAEVGYNGYQMIFGDFTYADAIDFPENLMILVETGCIQCDGWPDALYRVWRNDGETHVELLADAALSSSEDARGTSIAVRPTLHDIVVTVCNECANAPLASSSVTVYRSIDGGITWRDVLTTETGAPVFVEAITDEGIVLSNLDTELFYLNGEGIDPPAGADGLLPDSNRAGALRWLAEDGSTVLDAEGRPIAIVEPGSLISAVALNGSDPARAAVGWGLNYVAGPFGGWTVTHTGPDGRLAGFRLDTVVAPVSILNNGSVLGILSTEDSPYGGVIGYIDTLRGVLTPIHGALIDGPFGDGQNVIGRNEPQGAATGPFWRVTSGVNCLPIRVDTDSQSQELTCAVDGTLVYDLHNTTTVGAQEWARVGLLDGREGYTVTRYLTAE